MGLFDALFGSKNKIPIVTSILPDAARQEIIAGRLPILNTDKLFLKRGEKIHFIDKAVNMEEKTVKQFRHYGHSGPGLFEGTRWSSGRGRTVEHTELVQHRGILYITNQRIVFQAKEWGFDKTYRYLTAITPYSNACEMQFGNKSYCMIVADGSVVNQVLQLIKQREADTIMEGQLKNGTILTSESGNKYEVVSLLGAGGQGEVYDVKLGGNHYALKWYFKGSATERQKKILETIIAKGSPDESFLWPLELIVPAKSTLYGYIMPLRPKNYKSIVDLMKKRVNPSFYTLCRTAFNLTRGYQKLHAMGAKYQDISFGNLFFNPDNGDVLSCDNDNVSFDNSKPGGVLGTPGFMAPEIVRGEKRPSKDTDRYSLSVLLFYLFMVNHPLEGKLEASIRCMDMAARVKLYGTDPVFIFDPNNKMNRPVKGIHDNATIYWPLYPEKLRQMFTRAFTVGLNEPSKRITEPEWMTLFSNMMSGMLQCSCGAQLFYDEDLEAKGVAHTCWNCRKVVQVPNRITIGKNLVLLNQNTKLLHHHVYDDFDMDTVVGSVVQNPKNPALWGIRNEDKVNWTYQKVDGTQIPVAPGKTAGIAKGVKIIFPGTIGEFK